MAFRERPLSGSTATVKYQHTDALGSPLAVTDVAKALVESSEYEPYGQVVNKPLLDGPGYIGHVQDAATGLTYMQQRYYDPQIGRFLSADPVTAYSNPVGQFNRYRYANSNPYTLLDPDGRRSMLNHPGISASSIAFIITASVSQNSLTTRTVDRVVDKDGNEVQEQDLDGNAKKVVEVANRGLAILGRMIAQRGSKKAKELYLEMEVTVHKDEDDPLAKANQDAAAGVAPSTSEVHIFPAITEYLRASFELEYHGMNFRRGGDFALGIALAHELGHIVTFDARMTSSQREIAANNFAFALRSRNLRSASPDVVCNACR